jgi:hypothetical protein
VSSDVQVAAGSHSEPAADKAKEAGDVTATKVDAVQDTLLKAVEALTSASAVADITIVKTVINDNDVVLTATVEVAQASYVMSAGSDDSFQETRAFPSDLEMSDTDDIVFEPS